MSRTFEHLDQSIELVETYRSGARYRKLKGPHGRNLCRYCGAEVPPRRISYCSGTCSHHWNLMTNSAYARSCVFARDQGVCGQCGLDTEQCPSWRNERKSDWRERRQAWLIAHKYATWQSTSLWEADHMIEVINGGHDLGLENFQTLCVPCHKKKTATLAASRVSARKVTHRPVKEITLDRGM